MLIIPPPNAGHGFAALHFSYYVENAVVYTIQHTVILGICMYKIYIK